MGVAFDFIREMYLKTNMVVNSGCKDDQKVKEYLRVGANVMKKLREVFE